jgi:uncharacterized membrane protein
MVQTSARAPHVRRAHWYKAHSVWRSLVIRPRVYFAATTGLAALLFLPGSIPGSVREAMAWCLGGTVYLVLAFRLMARCDAERIRTRAGAQDDSDLVIMSMILLAMFSSFAAILGLISEAKQVTGEGRVLYIALAGTTILISWLVMQTVFTLHYAHEHYAPHNVLVAGRGGLTFPADEHPDYWDFFYFSTSIGATSQTSDVSINDKTIRRLVTLHAIVSFFFNTMVLALTINLAASLAG